MKKIIMILITMAVCFSLFATFNSTSYFQSEKITVKEAYRDGNTIYYFERADGTVSLVGNISLGKEDTRFEVPLGKTKTEIVENINTLLSIAEYLGKEGNHFDYVQITKDLRVCLGNVRSGRTEKIVIYKDFGTPNQKAATFLVADIQKIKDVL